MAIQRPPRHLSPEAKTLWKAILEEYDLEPAELSILKVALESYDRAQVCRQQVSDEGVTVTAPSGFIRAHPALTAEKQAHTIYLQSMRLLKFGEEPLQHGPGRPAGRR